MVFPAPTLPGHDLNPREVKYSGSTLVAKASSLIPSVLAPFLPAVDTWGNTRGDDQKDNDQVVEWPEGRLDTAVQKLIKVRNRVACWLLTLGFSRQVITMMQELRYECPIWKARATFFACSEVPTEIKKTLEQIDMLEWEILTMIKLPDLEDVDSDLLTNATSTRWFPVGGNKAVATITKSHATKFAQVQYDPAFTMNATMQATTNGLCTVAFDVPDKEVDIDIRTDMSSVMMQETFRKEEVPVVKPKQKKVTLAAVHNMSAEQELRTISFGDLVDQAPLSDPTTPFFASSIYNANTSGARPRKTPTYFTPDSDDEDQGNTKKKWDRSMFSAKDLGDRIPAVDMQKDDVAELYKFAKAVQRYAENPNIDKGLILDTIITKGQPNDRNLAWITRHFNKTFSERKDFFNAFRLKVLPFFSVDKLAQFALSYKFSNPTQTPARIIGSRYLDYMKPYLVLAKADQDRITAENLMRTRFWSFLGVQLRQAFEHMLMQQKIDPYSLSLEGIVDGLKAYANIVGGDVYANPDVTEDHSVLSATIMGISTDEIAGLEGNMGIHATSHKTAKKETKKKKDESDSDDEDTDKNDKKKKSTKSDKESNKKGQGKSSTKSKDKEKSSDSSSEDEDDDKSKKNKYKGKDNRENKYKDKGNHGGNKYDGGKYRGSGKPWRGGHNSGPHNNQPNSERNQYDNSQRGRGRGRGGSRGQGRGHPTAYNVQYGNPYPFGHPQSPMQQVLAAQGHYMPPEIIARSAAQGGYTPMDFPGSRGYSNNLQVYAATAPPLEETPRGQKAEVPPNYPPTNQQGQRSRNNDRQNNAQRGNRNNGNRGNQNRGNGNNRGNNYGNSNGNNGSNYGLGNFNGNNRGNYNGNNTGGYNGNNHGNNNGNSGNNGNNGKDNRNRPSVTFCYGCANPGHMKNECPFLRDSYDPTQNMGRYCTNCETKGHWHSDCPKKKGN